MGWLTWWRRCALPQRRRGRRWRAGGSWLASPGKCTCFVSPGCILFKVCGHFSNAVAGCPHHFMSSQPHPELRQGHKVSSFSLYED